MRSPRSFFAAAIAVVAGSALLLVPHSIGQGATAAQAYAGDAACAECHQAIALAYPATVHHRTSRLAEAGAIAGHFPPPAQIMHTLNPQLSFRMEQRAGRYYENAILDRPGHKTVRTEPLDIVVGTATKGQTYLYWKGDHLFELPVSYWTALDRWVNSPGYVDGSADFDRPVTARCLECHASSVETVGEGFTKDHLVLGIGCERCHGPGLAHIRGHRTQADVPAMPPAGLTRDRQVDICAQCHGGVGQSLKPPFSFRPGEALNTSLALQVEHDNPDVHGNQVNLLQRSRCYLSSPGLSCSTCHDVHAVAQPAAAYSAKCLTCHREQQCGMFARMGSTIASKCIDCHMPIQESKQLVLDVDDTQLRAKVRNHRIGIYPVSAR